jgi:hypothetical protein
MKTTTAQRVVVLGCEGDARVQLVDAFTDLGVIPVWVGRPAHTNPDTLVELNPNKIIVSLDPVIELELEPFSEFLSDPGRQVLYDEAEVTKSLSGWDLNRWARNMAAKMLGRDPFPASGPKSHAAALAPSDVKLDMLDHQYEFDADTAVKKIAKSDLTSESNVIEINRWVDNSEFEVLDIDEQSLNAALEQLNNSLAVGFNPDDVMELSFEQVQPVDGPEKAKTNTAMSHSSPVAMEWSLEAIDSALQRDAEPVRNRALSLDQNDLQHFIEEAQGAAPTLQPDDSVAIEPIQSDPVLEWSLDQDDLTDIIPPKADKPSVDGFDLSKFSLLDDIPTGSDFSAAHEPVDYREEVVDNGTSYGMILAISGLGGPAGVRTLVEQVPAAFSGVFVSAHHFNAGQLLPFRDQLQKIAKVPVCVAEQEEFLKNGTIYLFPKGSALLSTALGYQCVQGKWTSYIDQMDPNAQIIILSGADVELSQSLIQVSALSNAIHVQDPEQCFDANLVKQLKNAGAPIVNPDVFALWLT